MKAMLDSNIFLTLLLKDNGWKEVKSLIDKIYENRYGIVLSTIQLNEILTPLYRFGLKSRIENVKIELGKLRVKFVDVDKEISELAAIYRSKYRTPTGRWISLADSIILATAVISEVDTFYTLDIDFINVDVVNVASPIGSLKDWILRYGTENQKKLLYK